MLNVKSIGVRVGLAIAGVLVLIQGAITIYNAQHGMDKRLEAEIHGARNLILMSESVRENMERKWEMGMFSPEVLRGYTGTTPAEVQEKVLAAVPVVAAWESAKAKSAEGGFEFRTPRRGARNPDNEPDPVEREALEFFSDNRRAEEYHVIDEELNAVRYFRPVRLAQVCMNCHGDPANAKRLWGTDDGTDITGHKMEDKEVGDLHGAFEVVRPLDEAQAQIQQDLITGVSMAILGLALTLGAVAWLLRRFVSQPVSGALDTLARAEKDNDLTLRLDAQGETEVAHMAQAFNRFTERVQEFVRGTTDDASRLASASEELSVITTQTREGVRSQQSETDQVATAMNEMAATVQEVAQNTAAAAESAKNAKEATSNGQRVVDSSSALIQELSDEVNASAEVINELGQNSEAIGTVLDVIRNVAEQTNLLALNAAIEAARAGEHGRGFAVVADEVRTLASRTQESTQEIQDMIERLQEGSRRAAESMNRSQSKAQESSSQSAEASAALEEIARAVDTINDMNSQIATASEEQSAVAEEVSRNVTRINQIAEDTAKGADDTSSSSDELARLASALQERVQTFKA